ncbi:hypothetical protein PFISCL1PPCAC_25647 [Pristionchus fissidentatus]|uniref:Secreted protein n=1 Tax=Pristionchus fissidentatus TaxID=1538716 RepID=A0AAV5WUV1_9BILA|nr:hypothetical protein PFISCL1PPCAC_25647 [Pristionchus fissidentatus]
MVRSILLLVATVAVATAVPYTYPTTCVSATLNKCIHDIFSDGEYGLNVTTDPAVLGNIMSDYTILNNWFLSQWGRDDGIDTIVKNCNALTNFYHCLGGPVCFSMKSMLDDPSVTKEQAYAVRGVFDEYTFNCGAGLGTMLSANIKCIQNAVGASQEYLKGCTSTYLNNVKHDEPRACNHGAVLTQCYMAPFHLAECQTEVATDTWWACNSQKEFMAAQFGYTCYNDISCDDQQPAVASFIAKHHTKNADGSHTLRLPDLVQKSNNEYKEVKGRSINIKF